MTKWKVGLSNGDHYIEGNFPYEVFAGKKSPWLRLLEYLANNNVTITSLQIEAGTRVFSLPGEDELPNFVEMSQIKKPESFNFFRKLGTDVNSGVVDKFAVIEAIYPKYKLQIWVDENNPNHCWSVTKDIE